MSGTEPSCRSLGGWPETLVIHCQPCFTSLVRAFNLHRPRRRSMYLHISADPIHSILRLRNAPKNGMTTHRRLICQTRQATIQFIIGRPNCVDTSKLILKFGTSSLTTNSLRFGFTIVARERPFHLPQAQHRQTHSIWIRSLSHEG